MQLKLPYYTRYKYNSRLNNKLISHLLHYTLVTKKEGEETGLSQFSVYTLNEGALHLLLLLHILHSGLHNLSHHQHLFNLKNLTKQEKSI